MTKEFQPRKREFIELFERSGWSQADAARELDMTRGGINGIITGETEPSAALLKFFKLVLLSKGKTAQLVNESFTEQWFNDLLFELRALPAPQRDRLVESFRQIVSLFPKPPTSYRPVKKPATIHGLSSTEADAATKLQAAAVAAARHAPATPPPTHGAGAPTAHKPAPKPGADKASKAPPVPAKEIPK